MRVTQIMRMLNMVRQWLGQVKTETGEHEIGERFGGRGAWKSQAGESIADLVDERESGRTRESRRGV